MASSLFTDLDGQSIPDSEILGYGRSGVVILRDELAVKTPLRHPWSSEDEVQVNLEVLQREQEVYRRLNSPGSGNGQIDGVVPCIGFSTKAILLAPLENGDLHAYLEKNKPSQALQMSWFRQMARTLEQVHDKRVLVADIATRNYLLDSDLSVKLCDLTEASVLPLDTLMEAADDNGFSIQTDIGQLGAVMYEVVTGSKCEFDLFKDNAPEDGRATWPQRTSLPSTNGLWIGQIIEKCWTQGGFQNAHPLHQALSSFGMESTSPSLFDRSLRCLTERRSLSILAIVLTAATVLVTWTRDRRH
ncbi:serine/threonine-protein kinase HT1 [Aspergillus saccharolyticus JOP 1030-1]|uniref:Serine/threonine-protein kinase HT1 n=1 Tax=Aspergillus saccharolyticus JOP 1030-1 TaxID=1450539 RepID=A0A318Z759_9EURO|nr:serine/threonine-protein kinase HT1 [Aspergillus saccharolyticus JOP 1030-1]PYH42264.1 serine/threonine-protein kinase HT1 [Aspergillus saccharolyticus JOP 1030-1]